MKYIVFSLILILSLQVNAQTGIPSKVEMVDEEFHVQFKPQDMAFPEYLQQNASSYINNGTNLAFYPRTRTKVLWRGLLPLDNDFIEPGTTSHGYSGYNGSMDIEVQKLTASDANLNIILKNYVVKAGGSFSASNVLFNGKITEDQTFSIQFQEYGLKINNETLPDYLLYSEIEIYLELNRAQNWNHDAELFIQFQGHQNPALYEYLLQNYEEKQGISTTSTNIDGSSEISDTPFPALEFSLAVFLPIFLFKKKRNSGSGEI